jgi:hypothetical protein
MIQTPEVTVGSPESLLEDSNVVAAILTMIHEASGRGEKIDLRDLTKALKADEEVIPAVRALQTRGDEVIVFENGTFSLVQDQPELDPIS